MDYNADLALWAEEQAARLRAGDTGSLDRENIAEELESLARSMQHELHTRLAKLLQCLLQWEYLDGARVVAWSIAIHEERDMIPRLLDDAPSLRRALAETYADAWDTARDHASYATGLAQSIFPKECPYSADQALDVSFWPGVTDDYSVRLPRSTPSFKAVDGLQHQKRMRAEWEGREGDAPALDKLRGSVLRYTGSTDPIWPSETADHAARIMDAQALAREVFDDPTVAMQWLLSATPLLGDKRPIDALATEGGHERVRALLLRLAHGGCL